MSCKCLLSNPAISSSAKVSSCFTATSGPEPVLAIGVNMMFIQVIENIAGDYMLLELATKAGERDWSVIRRLTLLPFLKIAVMIAVLQSLGTISVSKLPWKIAVNIRAISLTISFKILAGSRSGPVALLGLSLSSSLKPLLWLPIFLA